MDRFTSNPRSLAISPLGRVGTLLLLGTRAVTAEWWDNHRLRYDVYVSPLVVEEISAGDPSAAEERLRVIADIPSVSIAAEAESLGGYVEK